MFQPKLPPFSAYRLEKQLFSPCLSVIMETQQRIMGLALHFILGPNLLSASGFFLSEFRHAHLSYLKTLKSLKDSCYQMREAARKPPWAPLKVPRLFFSLPCTFSFITKVVKGRPALSFSMCSIHVD